VQLIRLRSKKLLPAPPTGWQVPTCFISSLNFPTVQGDGVMVLVQMGEQESKKIK
jgi:hypothetical protein